MRRILIENARRRRALRHGGAWREIRLDHVPVDLTAPLPDDRLLLVHEALDRLAAHDPRKAELVKFRYFVGLSLEETAAVLDISEATAKRDWQYARAWLMEEIKALQSGGRLPRKDASEEPAGVPGPVRANRGD